MEKPMKTGTLIRRFAPYYRNYRAILFTDLFCAVLASACEVFLPLIIRDITDRAINDFYALTISFILRLGAFYIILRVINAFAAYYMTYIGHNMGARIETDMRRDLFAHLQQLSFSFYSTTKVGQIMARITSDLFEITEFSHHCPEEFLVAFVKIAASFAILCGMNVWLTLIIFAMLPLMYLFTRHFSRKMREAFKEQRHQLGEVNAQTEDSLLGVRVVKSFSNEPLEEAKFSQGNQLFLKYKIKAYRAMAGFFTTTNILDGMMYILVVIAGALFIMNGAITPADYVAYLLYVSMLLASIRRIVEFQEQFQRGMTGIERFLELMEAPVEIHDLPGAKPMSHVRGDIAFQDVSFRYSDGDQEVLAHLDLACRSGQSIALVGPSGGGKTTLCNLLPRFYELSGGVITIDGRDIRDFTLKSLRGHIGMVQQDVYLFAGSIYENIVYGKPDASPEEVRKAAERAGAHTFIEQLPQKYDTYVGERGVRLSGGQKQRISIARVFLKDPPILILDEATSSLDNESERIVQASLKELSLGRTTFTIAHRLTTIKNADTIWVLTDQGIVEKGSHTQLMAARGIYHGLYSMYAEDTV